MADIKSIVSQMTLEEKAALTIGATAWSTTPIERLNVPRMIVADGPHGVRRVPDLNQIAAQSLPATCFPTASALASTWDVDLIYEMGQTLADEAIALDVDVLLGPGVNMKRSPLGGRNFEYFSEDPFLAGEMAASLVNGIQSRGVGTSVKHFAANNQEFQRFTISAELDERTLREIYLPAFETIVKKANPWTIMCSYNKVNGTYASENHSLLTEILKDEWGFEGLVMSDWGAVRNRLAALRAGMDLEMPGPKPRNVQAIVDAVNTGALDESLLDESVRRILGIVFKAAQTKKGSGSFDVDAHNAVARKVSAESMVLLKNNGILPLKNHQHIAVIGRAAEHAHYQGGGSSHINAVKVAVPFAEVQKAAPDAEVIYAIGYPADDAFNQTLIDEATQIAQSADVALLYIALPSYKESEGYDRTDLDLTVQQVALIKAVSSIQPNTVVILNNGAPVVVGDWIDDVAAVLEAWMMGQAGGEAITDVLWGKVNPCGKLAETFPHRLQDTPSYLNFPGGMDADGKGVVRYGEGIFIGYRYYDSKEIDVRFPFGFGLSYTTFAYRNATVSATNFKDVEGVTVAVDVTNTGSVAGKEIVQLYVHDQKSGLIRPAKELKGFAKVELQAGETKTVSIALDFRSFAYYHPSYGQWITESGDFDLLIGASARDIRAKLTVTLQSTVELPSLLNRESTPRQWMDDARGQAVFGPMFEQMITQMQQAFGVSESGSEELGMNMMGFLMDTPLLSLLSFQESVLPAPAEVIVDGLLAKVHSM